MVDKSFEEGKKLVRLEVEVKKCLDEFKNPQTSDFGRDALMTIVTKNYMEYLRMSVEYNVPIREVKSVTENYLGILNEWVKQEG